MNTPSPESKTWAGGRAWMTRSFGPRDPRPHSACPQCHADATSPDTGSLLEFRCERGHAWITTRKQAEAHTSWLQRHANGFETPGSHSGRA